MSEPVHIAIPAKVFRAAIVLEDECQECHGPLGSTFHVISERRLCEFCHRGQVLQPEHNLEPPPE